MKSLALAIGLLATLPSQDVGTPERIVEDLWDDDVALREAATRRLIELGDAASAPLRRAAQGTDHEARARARYALAQIELQAKIRKACPEPALLTIDVDRVPAARVVEDLRTRAALKFAPGGLDLERPVTLRVSRATPLQVLDTLCAELRDVQWCFDSDGAVSFRPFGFVARPTCYSGPFIVALRRIDLYRTGDFAASSSVLALYLEARAEKRVRIAGEAKFTVESIVDDRGSELPVEPEGILAPFLRDRRCPVPSGEDVHASEAFTFRGPDRAARTLGTVRGQVTFHLALEVETLKIGNLENGASWEEGPFKISAHNTYSGALEITVHREEGAVPLERCLDRESVVVTDEDGEEHAVSGADVQVLDASSGHISFSLFFDRARYKRGRALRFNLIRELCEKSVPFEFTGVALP